ncbi:DEHA2E10098p [Debaryomyces hansenii CBS767]|uniref:DEHA2E10098p n=1 Tax=Debaryomyces hansenii (strain ATCC 36239 / CBS 767 / BCRC 21394 / JCM 1990 / NBRC 0083 / IGC 2968) TaxID=284592 RepID=Q6BPX5_DEBHA|nr:DEHA2E10098p [Debaryomyces hansenii CBS767]CAG87981.2 DEHA2E10098p [Debaryomyces hansenii CBS767]|eukprot:XP_459745.2 DEHA2E10098p [Debaryomyces hansenii CBS767]
MHLARSLKQSNCDIRLLWGSVFMRMASYGLTNQVLTLYLESLGVSETNIGLFMTLTLVGDTIISYFLTWYADHIGRRLVMIIGTLMMITSGLTFAFCSNFMILLIAAIFGVISPSGDETGPFKSVEEASIAHLTPHNHRPEIFAFHGLFATAGAALGSLFCGIIVDHLHLNLGWSTENSYRFIFIVYSGIAVVKFVFMIFLTEKCEVYYDDNELSDDSTEESSLLDENVYGEESSNAVRGSNGKSKFSGLSPQTKHYLSRLLVIFMLDSLGYGFMPSSWVVYYFKKVFKVTSTGLGVLFFLTNSIDSISSLPSAYFAKILGPVKAILFTQAPSAIFFILIAFTNKFIAASVCLLLYFSTSTMDVVPRQVLLTSIMPNNELTKAMGIVNIGKTFARCVGPIFTGKLAEKKLLHYAFVINGSCVLLADLILATNFLQLDKEILKKQKIDYNIQ